VCVALGRIAFGCLGLPRTRSWSGMLRGGWVGVGIYRYRIDVYNPIRRIPTGVARAIPTGRANRNFDSTVPDSGDVPEIAEPNRIRLPGIRVLA